MYNNVQCPRTSIARLASRTLFALAAALPMALAVDIPVTVNVIAKTTQAFESDPTKFGEIQVTRSATLLGTQAITLDLNNGATYGNYATLTTDFTLAINPADVLKATLGAPVAGSVPGTYTMTLTFNAGASSVRIQVIAVPDNAKPIPELGELVSISLPTIPPGGIVNGGNQRGTVTIVDANTQVVAYVDQSPAREMVPDDINNFVQGLGDGLMRLWFTNSSTDPRANPLNPTSYAVYGNRLVEVSDAGSSATITQDVSATYRIGGKQRCVEALQFVKEPTVTNLTNAFRPITEYGATSYTGMLPAQFPGYRDQSSQQQIATDPSGQLSSITVNPVSIPTTGTLTSITIAGIKYTLDNTRRIVTTVVSAGSVAGITRIDFIGFTISAPVAEGATVIIHYITIDPNTAAISDTDLNTTATMPILYPKGATSLSITQGDSPVILSKGDVFILEGIPATSSGASYRVTGTVTIPNANVGASLGDTEIFFTPGLRGDLLRTASLKIITHFEAKFDKSHRETFYIPGLPTFPYYGYPTGNNNEIVNVAGTANDLPNGDWVDFLFRPLDDDEVEGEEDILLTLDVTTATNGYEIISPEVARIPIGDDDVIIATELSSNAQMPVGNGGFKVELSQPFAKDIRVPFTVLQNTGRVGVTNVYNGPDALYGSDYTIANTVLDPQSGYVTGFAFIPAGSVSVVVPVTPNIDLTQVTLAVDASKSIRVVLDDSLDYALAGSVSGSTNASTSTITITRTANNTNPVPNITPATDSVPATIGTPFVYLINASGNPTSYSSTTLPAGLSLNTTTGAITGTPITVTGITYPSSSAVTISAINAGGTGTAVLTITINPIAIPVITSPLTASGTTGVGFSYIIAANGNAVSYDASGLPAPLVIDAATGAITGSPITAGVFTVTVGAINATGGKGTATLVITIATGTNPTTTTAGTDTGGSSDAGGGLCGSGSGVAILLGGLSLAFLRLTGKRR